MDVTHRRRVEALLAGAAAEHASLMSDLSPELQASVPVDAQGVTHAIDHLATAAGLSLAERRALADVVGGEPLGRAVRRCSSRIPLRLTPTETTWCPLCAPPTPPRSGRP